MKIRGLLFGRINEDFEIFSAKIATSPSKDGSEENASDVVTAYEERILSDSLKAGYEWYPKFFKAHSKNQVTISEEIGDSFRYFFAYLNAVDTIYENARKYLNEHKTPENYQFIIPHYGLLLRLADQIGVLLLNGYPDGALRIWRSFYEYAVVTLLFIKEIDNNLLQKKFIAHFHRNKKKNSESYQKNHEELKFPPLENSHFESLNQRIKELDALYGKDFLEDEYSWCKEVFNQAKKVTLRDIEDYVGMQKLRPFYIWASGYSHPGFASMLDFFEEDKQMVLLNKINTQSLEKKSFIDPMQLTIALFDQINIKFLKIYSDESEYDINVQMLRKIYTALGDTFDQ